MATAKVADLERSLAEMTVKAEGEECWAEVRRELELIAKNTPAGIIGRYSHSNYATSCEEDHCRLMISFLSTLPRSSYADLWYRPSDKRIRYRTTLTGQELFLFLGVSDGRICLTSESHPEPMNPEEAARLIAEPMVEYAMAGALNSILPVHA